MSDWENVIYSLKCITGDILPNCPNCKYYNLTEDFYDCVKVVAADALKLLEEQDKTIESLTKEKETLLLGRIAELQHNIATLHHAMQDTMNRGDANERATIPTALCRLAPR